MENLHDSYRDKTNSNSGSSNDPDPAVQDCGVNGISYQAMGLSAEQIKALHSLMQGQNSITAAKEAGVHRGTLSRWMNGYGPFRDAYAQWQASILLLAADQWKTLADEAVAAVRESLRKGNGALGFKVLKSLGMLGITSIDDDALQTAHDLRSRAGVEALSEEDLAWSIEDEKEREAAAQQARDKQAAAAAKRTEQPNPARAAGAATTAAQYPRSSMQPPSKPDDVRARAAAMPAAGQHMDPSKLNPGGAPRLQPTARDPLAASATAAVKGLISYPAPPGAQQLRATY